MIEIWRDLLFLLSDIVKRNSIRKIEMSDRFLFLLFLSSGKYCKL